MSRRRRSARLFSVLFAALFATVFCSFDVVAAADEAQFHWVDQPENGTADLLLGDEPVLRYMYKFDQSDKDLAFDTAKTFHQVFGPGTGALITKGVGGKYEHHRGLFVGWNKTTFEDQKLDFWHCKGGEHLRHAKFIEMKADEKHGSMTSEIHWIDRDGKLVITETRTVSASKSPNDADSGFGWQIDWKTTLKSHRGDIELNGDRQHAGFQFRAAQAIADSNGARYIRPRGFPTQLEAFQVSDARDPNGHIDLGWLAMTYELDGHRYTVEYFEDPALPKPSRYSERPYGRFGAFFKTTLKEDNPLTMQYRLFVTTGRSPSRTAIQQRYDAFVSQLGTASSE